MFGVPVDGQRPVPLVNSIWAPTGCWLGSGCTGHSHVIYVFESRLGIFVHLVLQSERKEGKSCWVQGWMNVSECSGQHVSYWKVHRPC